MSSSFTFPRKQAWSGPSILNDTRRNMVSKRTSEELLKGRTVIEALNLSKRFQDKKRGEVRAVDDVSFTCRPGEIYGLLGANGAGKTTTLRMLATILEPTEGTARLCGHDIVEHPE